MSVRKVADIWVGNISASNIKYTGNMGTVLHMLFGLTNEGVGKMQLHRCLNLQFWQLYLVEQTVIQHVVNSWCKDCFQSPLNGGLIASKRKD